MAYIDGEEHRAKFEKAISLIDQVAELVGDYNFPGDDYVQNKLGGCAHYLEDAISDEVEARDAELDAEDEEQPA